jgi:hypothetical protein
MLNLKLKIYKNLKIINNCLTPLNNKIMSFLLNLGFDNQRLTISKIPPKLGHLMPRRKVITSAQLASLHYQSNSSTSQLKPGADYTYEEIIELMETQPMDSNTIDEYLDAWWQAKRELEQMGIVIALLKIP